MGVLVGAGVGVGKIGVLVGAGLGVGGMGVLVGAVLGVGGMGVLDGAVLGVGGVVVAVLVGVGETVGAGDVVALGVGEAVGAGDVGETIGVAVGVAIRAVGDAAAMLACAAVGRISADDVRSGAFSQAASVSAAASAVSAAAMSRRRRPPRRALRKLHPRRAVSAALSRLRAETAHAAMIAQMLARHAPQDARAPTVNHPQPRHPVPRGVV